MQKKIVPSYVGMPVVVWLKNPCITAFIDLNTLVGAVIFQPDNNWHPYITIFIWNKFFALLVSQLFFQRQL